MYRAPQSPSCGDLDATFILQPTNKVRAWRAPQSPSCGDLEVTSSLHNKVLEQTLGEDRQAWGWSSSSPKDPGGAPASTSDCSQPPSPSQLAALEEGMGEQELLPTNHLSQLRNEMSSLKDTVGNLVLLISSFHKDDPNSFQHGTCDEHVWAGACKDKLLKEKGAKQEDPNRACSTTACRQTKEQMQLDQARLQEGQLETADLRDKQTATTACSNNNLGQNSLGTSIRTKERPPQRPWRILVDTGAELSVAPTEIQLSPLEQVTYSLGRQQAKQ